MPKKINKPQLTIGGEKIIGVKPNELNFDVIPAETPQEIINLLDNVRDILNKNFQRLGVNVSFNADHRTIEVVCMFTCQGITSYVCVTYNVQSLLGINLLKNPDSLFNAINGRIESALVCLARDTLKKINNEEEVEEKCN